jgi:putative hydrolase
LILADLHTHTRYSDGKGSIEQTVLAAKEKGLKQVGITEHGFRHIAFGIHRADPYRERREVDRLREKHPDIEILLGIEANIYCSRGKIDLKPHDLAILDYVVAGYHMAMWPQNPVDFFRYNLMGLLKIKNPSKSQRALFTKTFVNAIKQDCVKIISHLGYALPVNVKEVAQAAYDYGVLMELNGKKVSMTDEEVLTLTESGAGIIANSDAHSPSRVGDVSVPLALLDKLNINKNILVNWDKKVVFSK